MRRKDREMDEQFAWMVADKCEYATVAMSDADGAPYCVPITPVRIGDCLYFHSAMEGHKSDLLRQNGRVCVCCVGDTCRQTDKFTTEYESAILFGEAAEVTDDEEKVAALRALCERHTPQNMGEFDREIARSLSRTAIWRIRVTSLTGKRKKLDANGKDLTYGRME